MLVLVDVNVQSQCKFGRLLAIKAVYEAVSGDLNELLTLWDKKDAYTEDQARSIAFLLRALTGTQRACITKGDILVTVKSCKWS